MEGQQRNLTIRAGAVPNLTYMGSNPAPDDCVRDSALADSNDDDDALKKNCRVTQPNFDHLLDSTTSIHFIPVVEFIWYKMYRGCQI